MTPAMQSTADFFCEIANQSKVAYCILCGLKALSSLVIYYLRLDSLLPKANPTLIQQSTLDCRWVPPLFLRHAILQNYCTKLNIL